MLASSGLLAPKTDCMAPLLHLGKAATSNRGVHTCKHCCVDRSITPHATCNHLQVLEAHPINAQRIAEGKPPANVVLLRGCGSRLALQVCPAGWSC